MFNVRPGLSGRRRGDHLRGLGDASRGRRLQRRPDGHGVRLAGMMGFDQVHRSDFKS